ncbi:MAG: class I SAM-dependent methyltransferase [Thermoplasmata archaeon]
MNSWDAIFLKGRFTSEYPQAEVAKFVSFAEKRFEGEQLKCWDHCCGAGRHTLMLASRGHKVFASDASRVALDILENRLKEKGLNAEVKIADMCECPWNEEFHIVISWDAIH